MAEGTERSERTALRDRAAALANAGAFEEAVSLLRQAVDDGWIEACFDLALIEKCRGEWSAARAWIRVLADAASMGDSHANFLCYLAYSELLGEGTSDAQRQKSRNYLLRAAELGLPAAQLTHAQESLWGLNDTKQDEAEYNRWIAQAISQNLPEAIVAHVNNMMRLDRPVEQEVRQKLELLATDNRTARDALRKLRLFEKLRRRKS